MSTSRARWAARLFAAGRVACAAGAAVAVTAAAVSPAYCITTSTSPSAEPSSPDAAPAYAAVLDHPLTFPADFGSHPQFRTEWWYVTGWLTTEHGESLGFQITFFRTKPDIDGKQSQRLHAPSDPDRALRHQRSEARPPMAGPAHPARRVGARRSGDRRYRCVDRRLDARAQWVRRRQCHPEGRRKVRIHSEDRCRGFFIRSDALGDTGRSAQRRLRSQPQGACAGRRELLLQPAALASFGPNRAAESHGPGDRRSLVRSRMVQRILGRGRRRLGLDRHQFAGWRGAHGISHPRLTRRAALGRRHAARERRQGANIYNRRILHSAPCGVGFRLERESSIPCNGISVQVAASSTSSRCSTIRRTILGFPRVQSIGRVRYGHMSSVGP